MALAEALSEPGHPSTRDQVMLKGHELHPGHCGTHSSPPETRSQYVDVSLDVLCTPSFIYEWTSRACPFTSYGGNSRCPFINKGVVFLFRSCIHSTMWCERCVWTCILCVCDVWLCSPPTRMGYLKLWVVIFFRIHVCGAATAHATAACAHVPRHK